MTIQERLEWVIDCVEAEGWEEVTVQEIEGMRKLANANTRWMATVNEMIDNPPPSLSKATIIATLEELKTRMEAEG